MLARLVHGVETSIVVVDVSVSARAVDLVGNTAPVLVEPCHSGFLGPVLATELLISTHILVDVIHDY